MPSRLLLALLALAAAGCAATTPPPRFSAVSPADPDAPEGALPPASAVLTAGPEATPSPAPAASPTPTPTPHHHGGRP
jgi:hypothetical protein